MIVHQCINQSLRRIICIYVHVYMYSVINIIYVMPHINCIGILYSQIAHRELILKRIVKKKHSVVYMSAMMSEFFFSEEEFFFRVSK